MQTLPTVWESGFKSCKTCETNGFKASQTPTVWCNDAIKALDENNLTRTSGYLGIIADTDKKINEVKTWTLKEMT